MMDGTRRSFDLEAIRADFPILSREVHGKPLAIWTAPPRPKNRHRCSVP